MRGGNALPAAIFASAIVIAIGIYFGLRAQGPTAAAPLVAPSAAVDSAASTANAATSGVSEAPPRVVPPANPLAPAAPTTATDDASAKEARAALERLRPKFVETCWKPAARKKKDPPSAQYSFMLVFDAAGRERARGISDMAFGEAARTDVSDCLRNLPSPITITPTNAPVTVEVTLTLP